MLETFKQLFEVMGFECSIKNDYDGHRLELTYILNDDLGTYKFLKIRDAIGCSCNNIINEVGFDYNFATLLDGSFMVSELSYEDIFNEN